jgi:hypothetical protein
MAEIRQALREGRYDSFCEEYRQAQGEAGKD